MSAETVYQVVKFEAVYLSDPDLDEVVSSWTDGEGSVLENMPQDSLQRLVEDNYVLLLNTATGGIGALPPESFALNFEHSDPTVGSQALQKTVIDRLIEEFTKLLSTDETEDYFRGVVEATDILQKIQEGFVDIEGDADNENQDSET